MTGLQWADLSGEWHHLMRALEICDGQIADFWTWYDGQMEAIAKKNSPTAPEE